ncbi:hypothetical protein BGW36DRAFT_412987 [Talaromyces proteolyticus]|uniref:(S)-ureidoglycine aminohydrolase cupin domain-containing protein n=1 Tax=Talaromyces proteolyticus TaxID=1131652 RepID=A0AAD4Q601_9EURO|nr:uncharacterized protein BGW36DRAFT_412987 [Talaromyces proteolyticus]KAH8704862.1 hypothetical protein BGW36DRAFT_412987 [Talaromyces proteolyticus]
MPESKPNLTGDLKPTSIPHGAWDSFPWEPLPEWGGSKSVIYRSQDGKVAMGAFRETGKATLTYPNDEFFIVTSGWIDVKINGGESFRMTKGDLTFIKKGQTVDFVFSDDSANVAVYIGDEKITMC